MVGLRNGPARPAQDTFLQVRYERQSVMLDVPWDVPQ